MKSGAVRPLMEVMWCLESSLCLQVPVESGHAEEYRTSKVGSVSEAKVSFHRKTQSQLSG